MVHKSNDREHLVREGLRGGKGIIETDVMYKAEEMMGKATLFNRMVIKPGSSIGPHHHVQDAEIYYVLEGEVTVSDNGTEVVMTAGDAMFTGGGEMHMVENRSDKDARMLAIVIA